MRIGLIILCCFVFGVNIWASEVLIQGNGIAYRNQSLKIFSYSEFYTFTTQELASTTIEDDGNFSFKVEVPQAELYLLKIGRINAHLFVEPDVKYTLILPDPPIEALYGLGKDPFIQPEVFETGGQLNFLITSLERDLNTYTLSGSLAVEDNSRNSASKYAEKIKEKYGDKESEYFQDYLKYRLIEFLSVNGLSRSKKLFQAFTTAGINYRQLSYANSLKIIFANYLRPHSVSSFSDSAMLAIRGKSYASLEQIIKREERMVNDSLRELVLITQLYELAMEGSYQKAGIAEMLEQVVAENQNEAHRTIAQNAINRLTYLSPGKPAPNFDFTGVEGDGYDLTRFNGKVIYIQFFDQLTPETLRQMSLMKVLKDGYGHDIAMFSLSVGMNPAELKHLSFKYDFNWFFGSVNDGRGLIQTLELRSMPAYLLVDEKGRIIESPSNKPGAKIERTFARMYEEAHPGSNKPFKLQPPQVSEDQLPPRK